MKILWLSHFLPFPSTGHGALQRTHHLLRQVSTAHEVALFAISNGAGTERDILGMGAREAKLAPARTGASRVAAALSAMVRGESYWSSLFRNDALRDALARSARDADAVLLDIVFLAAYLDCVPALRELPLILNHHNVESQLLEQRASGANGIARAYFAYQARLTARAEREWADRAALNLVVSPEDASRLRDVAPNARTHVVPNGVDIEFFQSRPTESVVPYSLVYAGGMNWFPNRDGIQWLAMELWPKLVAAEPRRTLTVIGTSPPSEILELASRDSRVTVTGFVPDVRPYIDRAAAYICPIRIGGGTRLKVLDALAMRRPLVATELSVDGLAMHPNTHYVAAESPEDFVRALARLDADPGLAESLAANGRAHVESHFSWTQIGAELSAAIPAAIGRS